MIIFQAFTDFANNSVQFNVDSLIETAIMPSHVEFLIWKLIIDY